MHDEAKLAALLKKIRALKAKAEDPSVTEHEALAFTAKVQELLGQYGLEEAQLKVEERTEVGHEDVTANWNNSVARRALIIAICHLYMVSPIIYKHSKAWSLVGKPHNIIMVKEMAKYLIKTTLRLSNQYGKEHPEANIVDFRRGCFARLAERLNDLRWDQEKQATQYTPQGNPGNLPALYENEKQLTKAYISKKWPHTGTYKMRGIKQGWDAQAGRAAGDSISLNRQVAGGRSNHLIGRK